jgi:hypothetical protein
VRCWRCWATRTSLAHRLAGYTTMHYELRFEDTYMNDLHVSGC